jgi:hypothetical protein
MRLVDDRFEFFNCESWLGDEFAIFADPGAVGHIDLDPVRTMIELLPRGFASLDRAVDQLGGFWQIELGSIALQHVAAGRGNCPSGNKQAWSRNVTQLNRFFDADVAVACALSLEIAQGGEALF